ncbi:PD40 domain-containing protein [Microvirga mediterraneensis]|uniref:PD40 domain-containing protein n=1 Tax=Microvirga mediterraneensis TaxID=2754695 RepID=A0A838BTR1_9HYPH|nr:PD40 domain-containing protein [Microvirga mediterraneensis]MBA1158293.1 PD40 domain-containing protein [Microvirga mediterraneensis]
MTLSFNLQSFARLTDTNLMSRVSTGSDGGQLTSNSLISLFSPDGHSIAFLNVDAASNYQVFIKDLQTGLTRLVSTNAAGGSGDGATYVTQFSDNGRFLVLLSTATNLVPGDTNGQVDVFIKDLVTGAVTRVSVAADGSQIAQGGSVGLGRSLTADGRFLVFSSREANLVGSDTNSSQDVFLKDLQTGAIRRVSTNSAGAQADSGGENATISADGRHVAFESNSTDLVAGGTDGGRYLFLKDLQTGATTRIDARLDGSNGGQSINARFSANGCYIVFESTGANLVSRDDNGTRDIFRKDLLTGAIIRVSTKADGTEAHGVSTIAAISPDGRYVTFASTASDLVAGDTNGKADFFRKDLVTGEIVRLSITPQGQEAIGGDSSYGSPSADGRYLTFTSAATNLVAGDTNGVFDIFVVDTALIPHRQAVLEGRYVEGKFQVGTASNVSIAWGDGTADILTPAGGEASFGHAYASAGSKNAVVTVSEGSLTWVRPYTVDIVTGQMSAAGMADSLTGGAAADTLVGDAFDSIIKGNGGNDRLSGDAGRDVLWGGAGNDTLAGGEGQDVFVFDLKPHKTSNFDKVADFNVKDDAIWLENKVFKIGKGTLSKPGKLSKNAFYKGAKAHDADDRIIYDHKKGVLYYDADGKGAAAPVKIASLPKNLKMMAADFFVI